MKKYVMLVIVFTVLLGACTAPVATVSPTPMPSATVQPSATPTATLLPSITPEPTTPPEPFLVQDGTLMARDEETGGYEAVLLDATKVYEVDGTFYSFDKDTNELLTITPPPERLTAKIQLDPVEGVEYLYAFDAAGTALYRWDVKTLRYDTPEKRWRKLNLSPFSEYYKPTYQAEYSYKSEDGKLEIPLHIGLSDLPVTKVFFKEPMVELMGQQWLYACWYRYTEHMGNDVTFDEYLELVKQGQGQVEMVYRDEVTGQDKKGLIDPRTGFSVMITGENNLPLKIKADHRWPSTYQITVNGAGQPVLVFNINKDFLEQVFQEEVDGNGYTPNAAYILQITLNFLSAITYWADLSWEELIRGGQILSYDNETVVGSWKSVISKQWENTDMKTATETYLASVEYER